MSARGRPLTQARVREWAKADGITVLCGRFEGVDQRVLDARGFEEVSVGDAVLAGGEAAAMVVIEACVRLIPGVLGQAESLSSRASRTVFWSIRSIRDRGRSRGWRYPRCFCRATIKRSPHGARNSGERRPGSDGQTSGRRIRTRPLRAPRPPNHR
jgi:hypothetical protein